MHTDCNSAENGNYACDHAKKWESMHNEESLGAGWYFLLCPKFPKEVWYPRDEHSKQGEGTPRVTISPLALRGKGPKGRLERCFWEDAGITRSSEGQRCFGWKSEGVADSQSSDHFSKWACKETGDLPATWDKLALLNSSAGTSAWEERSAPVGQLSGWHFQSMAIYSLNRKLFNKR